MIAAILLSLAGLYLLCGLIFAVPFVMAGVGKIDPHAAHGSWGFRLLILPGATLLWPLLAKRWMQGVHEPQVSAECIVHNEESPTAVRPDKSASNALRSTL